MGELSGQVAIVTGGGRGIGRAIAHAFAAEGARVAVSARSTEQLRETVAGIDEAGSDVIAVSADVSSPDSVARLVAEVERRLGPVDVLVNSAGTIGPVAPVWEIEPEDWRRCMDTNLYGTFLCRRAVLSGMLARGRGRIVNLAGSRPTEAVPYFTCYDGTKAAIVRFTEGLAVETKEHGISVFALMPGGVHTAMVDELIRSPWAMKLDSTMADFEQRWLIPPERPAALCVFLASGRADALSGRYFSVFEDPEKTISRAEEILKNDLNVLRLRL